MPEEALTSWRHRSHHFRFLSRCRTRRP